MKKLNQLTIKEAKEGLSQKKFSSLELTQACLAQIERIDKKIHAFITVTKDIALEKAREADKLLARGVLKPLLGIPISVKDNFNILGVKTTASSKVLENYISPYNSTVWQKLVDSGAVLLGKTNMDAWAHGSSTETSDFGPTLNPWDTTKLPGGSSGGSAASVAADEAVAAIGSETAGSIRQPASWCGVVGFKPTYGRVSRYGVIAMGSSLDCPGPITKTVYDSALITSIISGKDPYDATTLENKIVIDKDRLNKDFFGITIGYSDDYFENVDKSVSGNVKEVIKLLERKGISFKKIDLFSPKYAIAVYTIIQRSEVSSNLARYDGIRYGNPRDHFGDEAKRRIMLGTYTLSSGYYDAYYKKAQEVRTIIIKDFERAFKEVDLIIAPTSPSVALPVGATADQSMFGEMSDVLVEPSSIAGLTGINIPTGMKENLPIGTQLFASQGKEQLVLQLGHLLEKELHFKRSLNL